MTMMRKTPHNKKTDIAAYTIVKDDVDFVTDDDLALEIILRRKRIVRAGQQWVSGGKGKGSWRSKILERIPVNYAVYVLSP